MKTMDWIKKNWIWIAIVLIVIAVIVGIIRKNKADNTLVIKLPKFPKMAGRGSAGESSEQAKAKLDQCNKGLANVRLSSNMPHPCAALQDAFEKAKMAESGYFMEGGFESNYGGLDYITPFKETEAGLNTVAFGIGDPGTSLLKDGSL